MTFTAWSGTLAFGPWWLLYCGPIGPTELHAHHAFQIVVHGGTACVHGRSGEPIHGPIAVVEPNQPHAIHSRRDHAVVVFIEPESRTGHALRHRSAVDPVGPGHPVSEVLGDLLPDNWSRAEEAVRRTLSHVGVPDDATPLRWWRHPAVDEAIVRIPDLVDAGALDVDELATAVGVSTSRLTHVFSSEIGIPLRSYARWLRLVTATEHLADGCNITEAAHAAGFADAAHFSRTFKEMFGLAPSHVTSVGTWVR
jgi:AraC-like DNA-binding protein